MKKELINSAETAAELGIHEASIRNWMKHGYLKPFYENNILKFSRDDIDLLKQKIQSGEIQRLNKRANKSHATKTFIPDEYSNKPEINSFVLKIAEHIVNNKLDINISLFYLTLNLLRQNEQIKFCAVPLYFHSANPYLQKELIDWMNKLPGLPHSELYNQLLAQNIPCEEDILGFIYQSVLAEGKKAKQGSYYTPYDVVLSIMDDNLIPSLKILDPCCGTGRFLLNAACKIDPENIYGSDIDQLAVRIAKINLMLHFRDRHFKPNIFCSDMLLNLPEGLENNFDVIASNPPWGIHFSDVQLMNLKRVYPEITSGESFSYFIRRSTDLLKEGGVLSFILPESILFIKTHKDIRKYILDNYTIIRLYKYGSMFKNVFSKVIRIDLQKTSHESNDSEIKIFEKDESYFSSQRSIYRNPDYRFNFHNHAHLNSLLEKIYSQPHTTLKNQAEWALGIVTGDNKKYLSPVKLEGCEEVFTGREVSAYKLNSPKNYITFTPERFQQVAPEAKYRVKEKLIYKFISNKLVFAYDDQQKLTLNSANILIPKIMDFPIKTILALLNSSVFQFLFRRQFNSIKVLRSHLETLPFPTWDDDIHQQIIYFVNLILEGKNYIDELDLYISNQFKLTNFEKKYLSE